MVCCARTLGAQSSEFVVHALGVPGDDALCRIFAKMREILDFVAATKTSWNKMMHIKPAAIRTTLTRGVYLRALGTCALF